MVPLRPEGRIHALDQLSDVESPELLAIRHALIYARPSLWADDAWHPRSVVLLRPEPNGRGHQAFGMGEPVIAVPWLMSRIRRTGVALVAPANWTPWFEVAVGSNPFETSAIETWHDIAPPPRARQKTPEISVERLNEHHLIGFQRAAPDWALLGWGDFQSLLHQGAVFGVPHQGGFASLAWIFDQTEQFDSLGLFTVPRYRQLGLGRACAKALIDHIQHERGKKPVWSTSASNEPSRHLARRLGFQEIHSQPLLRSTGREPAIII